eukprot:837392-Pyramimonas_sp.AAC.1
MHTVIRRKYDTNIRYLQRKYGLTLILIRNKRLGAPAASTTVLHLGAEAGGGGSSCQLLHRAAPPPPRWPPRWGRGGLRRSPPGQGRRRQRLRAAGGVERSNRAAGRAPPCDGDRDGRQPLFARTPAAARRSNIPAARVSKEGL